MSRIGFVLVTHDRPARIRRLADRLIGSFGDAIVCHHDFSQCPLPEGYLPKEVRFVHPHHATRWGTFGPVRAILARLKELYDHPNSPDWFVLLSGADYPIKAGAVIREELCRGNYDACLHHELIDPGAWGRDWHRLCHWRYFFGRRVRVPRIRAGRLRWDYKRLELGRFPGLTSPFTEQFRCFAGETWFSANRQTVEYILNVSTSNSGLHRHFKRCPIPAESYFQCILGNARDIRIANDCKRYIDWSLGGPHPKTLTAADLPMLLRSPAHFARKFDPEVDTEVLDRLDEAAAE